MFYTPLLRFLYTSSPDTSLRLVAPASSSNVEGQARGWAQRLGKTPTTNDHRAAHRMTYRHHGRYQWSQVVGFGAKVPSQFVQRTENRRTMNHSRLADRASSPEQSDHPRKRQKTAGAALSGDEDAPLSTVRQSKACANCRKVKVKCVTAEEGRASGRCTRCLRLDIVCLRQKKSWTAGDAMEDEASKLSKLADSYECGTTL